MVEKLIYLIVGVLLLGVLALAVKWLLAVLGVPYPVDFILLVIVVLLVALVLYRYLKV